MKILMISLDKQILDPESRVAGRMIEYGKEDELFIVIPASKKSEVALSETVHVWSTGGNKILQLMRLARMGKRIAREKNIECITTQDPFFTGWIGVRLKKRLGTSLEVQLHGDFYSTDYYKKSGFMNWVRYWIGKRVIKKADTLRVVGKRIKESILRMGIPQEKIIVRPVQTDSAAIEAYEPQFNLHECYPQFKKIFLALGRFARVKNLSWLIDIIREVVRQHPDWGLIIVGGGVGLTRYRLEENIIFEGYTDNPWSYLKTADCVLFPSLSEGYGLVPMEAHAAGTPIIMNDVGVANYELPPSDKVKIIPVSNRDAWIEAMLSI